MRRHTSESAEVPSALGVRIGIAAAEYHRDIFERLLGGAESAYQKAGGRAEDLRRAGAEGVFDLPPLVAELLHRKDVDGVVVIGCVLRGDTRHDRHIVDAAFGQFTQLAAAHRKPVSLAVLTVDTMGQAKARSGGRKGDAGAFAMNAALRTHAELHRLRAEKHS
ncbi:MAG: 6,7-dimethyl-8-ribityllumazine synthase [Planctomycetes bacterium]|nr:6,7-dimethyl-8-ribityllumazine synthase [Planctomycetota bacterium]